MIATEIAASLGAERAANMVMLGALLQIKNPVDIGAVERALDQMMQGPRKRYLEANIRALHEGYKIAAE